LRAGGVMVWLMICGVAVAGFFIVVLAPASPLKWVNDDAPARRRNFVNLLGLTSKTLMIVTGCLHRGLYGDAGVVSALKSLPDVRIEVFYDAQELDEAGSAEFIAELRKRKASIQQIEKGLLSHGAVFDDLHGKVEQFGIEDDEADKAVQYFAYDRARARSMTKAICKALKGSRSRHAQMASGPHHQVTAPAE